LSSAIAWGAALAVVWSGLAPGAESLKLGAQIPAKDAQLKNIDGQMLSLAGIAGKKGTLVIFSCNHCPFVKAWQKRMVALGKEGVEKGIGVVFVNSNDAEQIPEDSLEKMKALSEQEKYSFPYVMDEKSSVAVAFGAARTPEAFLFDADGKLVYHGAIDDNPHEPDKVQHSYLKDAVAAMLAGKEIGNAETKSVGCTIKFHAAK
jgi:peroxiredoxin